MREGILARTTLRSWIIFDGADASGDGRRDCQGPDKLIPARSQVVCVVLKTYEVEERERLSETVRKRLPRRQPYLRLSSEHSFSLSMVAKSHAGLIKGRATMALAPLPYRRKDPLAKLRLCLAGLSPIAELS